MYDCTCIEKIQFMYENVNYYLLWMVGLWLTCLFIFHISTMNINYFRKQCKVYWVLITNSSGSWREVTPPTRPHAGRANLQERLDEAHPCV